MESSTIRTDDGENVSPRPALRVPLLPNILVPGECAPARTEQKTGGSVGKRLNSRSGVVRGLEEEEEGFNVPRHVMPKKLKVEVSSAWRPSGMGPEGSLLAPEISVPPPDFLLENLLQNVRGYDRQIAQVKAGISSCTSDGFQEDVKPDPDVKPVLVMEQVPPEKPRAISQPQPRFALKLVRTLPLPKGMLPSTGVFLPSSSSADFELLIQDMADREKVVLFEFKDGRRLGNQKYVGPFKKTASAIKSQDGYVLCVTDQQAGVHFFNSATKQTLTKIIPMRNLWAAQQFHDKIVCLREDSKHLSIVVLDPSKQSIIGELPIESRIRDIRETLQGQKEPKPLKGPKAFGKRPAFRFMAVDAQGPEDVRFALVDWGLDRVFVINMAGQLLRIIGGHGSGPGEFNDPGGAVFLPDGRLLVADSRNHRVQLFGAENFELLWSGPLPGGAERPSGMSLEKEKDGSWSLHLFHMKPPGVSKFGICHE